MKNEEQNSNKSQNSVLNVADVGGNADFSRSAFNRQELAMEIMKVMLANQGRYRRMTLLSKLKFALGMNGWKANFDYNFNDTAKKSFMMADEMLKADKE